MGAKQNGPFQVSFNASLKVDFQGSRVTSDGGLVLVRELDERLGFGEPITQHLSDSRRGKNTQLPLADLFRQSVYSRIAGYADVNDAERLAQDPTFHLIGSEKIWERGAALGLIANNLGNLWRRLVLPRKIENWSLTSLQQRLVKTGGRLIKQARYYRLLLAESQLTRRLFGAWWAASQYCRCSPDRLWQGSTPGMGREWPDRCLRNCLK